MKEMNPIPMIMMLVVVLLLLYYLHRIG